MPLRRYAEGTNVAAENSQAEIRGLLAKHGVMHQAWAESPERAALQFVLFGLPYRFEVERPTEEEMRARYRAEGGYSPNNVAWEARVEGEWKRRWRARLLWLKATLEFAVGEGKEEVERMLLPYLSLPGGKTMSTWAAEQLPAAFRDGAMPPLQLTTKTKSK